MEVRSSLRQQNTKTYIRIYIFMFGSHIFFCMLYTIWINYVRKTFFFLACVIKINKFSLWHHNLPELMRIIFKFNFTLKIITILTLIYKKKFKEFYATCCFFCKLFVWILYKLWCRYFNSKEVLLFDTNLAIYTDI